jgi:hypothetical protein
MARQFVKNYNAIERDTSRNHGSGKEKFAGKYTLWH